MDKRKGKRSRKWVNKIVESRIRNGNSKLSEETKRKIGLANKGRLKGIPFTEEHKRKISQALKGKRKKPFINSHGYNLLFVPNHPFCNGKGHLAEHRIIMEQKLGRYLTKEEIIHHKNGIKNDNRIENLELCINRGEHIKKERKIKNWNNITGRH